MKKEEIQQRVLQNGKPLDLELFTWGESTNTFSSAEKNLVIDFGNVDSATIDAGDSATIKAGSYATIDAGSSATIKAGHSATIDAGSSATIKAGKECVIVNRNVFQVIMPEIGETIKICPYNIAGYISKKENEDAFYMDIDGVRVEHIIADGILSRVVKKKGNVYHVINHGEENQSYLVTDGESFAHGLTIKDAKESLIYKISDTDTSEYQGLTLDSEVTFEQAVKMYRKIAKSCESQTKAFAEKHKKPTYTISELIQLTEGQFNNQQFKQFFVKWKQLKNG